MGDFVARYGGEEFVCLMDVETVEGLGQLTGQLRLAIEALHIPHEGSLVVPWVTVSIGAALCEPAPRTSVSALLEQADVQLYRAKQAGRNQVCLMCA